MVDRLRQRGRGGTEETTQDGRALQAGKKGFTPPHAPGAYAGRVQREGQHGSTGASGARPRIEAGARDGWTLLLPSSHAGGSDQRPGNQATSVDERLAIQRMR